MPRIGLFRNRELRRTCSVWRSEMAALSPRATRGLWSLLQMESVGLGAWQIHCLKFLLRSLTAAIVSLPLGIWEPSARLPRHRMGSFGLKSTRASEVLPTETTVSRPWANRGLFALPKTG